ncbi:carboxylating nicotinate-nucleotide diphosphorylase [Algoriphagus sediminis]|uniref:nicotinate-nucleotide diphosphorylase (carboxylating) n=1 Tax=Algoriphagus sediminis TaxID=3057113 RepID=A0ABT7YBL4_9BACT|nr:carboxylating nicotinate-nucleotide diphosphorylase [Algoriphagus sediminis]MDN3203914.1 carboxylating nicotinate-nucleotide diphosphorylase [Algoriphagus sediminis]
MTPEYITEQSLQEFIQAAFREDIGPGDFSSLGSIPEGTQGKAQLLIKGDGIIAGVEMAKRIFHAFDPELRVEILIQDGKEVRFGDVGLKVYGKATSILSSERLVLNCMQRMSGIATITHRLTQKILHTKARLMDTRKTTPNFRLMEKWAVAIGGGLNHRFALYDMVMLKDNHVDFAGGISKAVNSTVDFLKEKGLNLKIEVETRTLEEVHEAASLPQVDCIMLDNMDYATMREAVKIINGRAKTEASGGITEETLVDVAECGVDYISMGALTHSVKSMDISLKAF